MNKIFRSYSRFNNIYIGCRNGLNLRVSSWIFFYGAYQRASASAIVYQLDCELRSLTPETMDIWLPEVEKSPEEMLPERRLIWLGMKIGFLIRVGLWILGLRNSFFVSADNHLLLASFFDCCGEWSNLQRRRLV